MYAQLLTQLMLVDVTTLQCHRVVHFDRTTTAAARSAVRVRAAAIGAASSYIGAFVRIAHIAFVWTIRQGSV